MFSLFLSNRFILIYCNNLLQIYKFVISNQNLHMYYLKIKLENAVLSVKNIKSRLKGFKAENINSERILYIHA